MFTVKNGISCLMSNVLPALPLSIGVIVIAAMGKFLMTISAMSLIIIVYLFCRKVLNLMPHACILLVNIAFFGITGVAITLGGSVLS